MTLRALRKLLQGTDPDAEVIIELDRVPSREEGVIDISVIKTNKTFADGSHRPAVVIKCIVAEDS